jgi:hypothetical protein
MRGFIIGMLATVSLVALIAASDGGFSVVWEMEMKRPEAQRAVSDYIQQYCEVDIYNFQVKQLGDAIKDPDHVYAQPLQLHCRVATK